MDLFIWLYFYGCESLPTQGPLPRKKVGLDIDFSSAQDVQLLLSVDLRKHLLGRVDLPNEFVCNSCLESLGPMAKEEDTRLDELKITVASHVCIYKYLPCLTYSLSLSRN